MAIKFGTSGWRGLIADDFTFPNLRIITQAIAEEIFKRKEHNKHVVIGYDTRFLSENFALESARILANNGIEVRFSDRDVPTPVVAFETIRTDAAAAINITASHNPWDYSGLKLSAGWGGSAPNEVTHSIEKACLLIAEQPEAIKTTVKDAAVAEKLIQRSDFRPAYFKHIKSLLQSKAFKNQRLKVVVDVLWGTGSGYLAAFLRDLGCDVEVLHDRRDVLFGGGGPDPSTGGLQTLVERVKKSKAHLGLATDGDSDRFGVVDAGGTIYSANEVLALLVRYLHLSRGWTGTVAKSVMTTSAIDAVCRKYGLPIKETPVGFKYIAEIMRESESIMPSREGEFLVGAEESGGFTMRGHVPEKDGILACLLVAEMVAASKKSIGQLLADLYHDVGTFNTRRLNIKATPELVTAVKERFAHKPPVEIDGLHVRRIVDLDGFKFIFADGSWLGLRFSGTEPIVRFYLEGNSAPTLDRLQAAGETLIYGHAGATNGVARTRKKRATVAK